MEQDRDPRLMLACDLLLFWAFLSLDRQLDRVGGNRECLFLGLFSALLGEAVAGNPLLSALCVAAILDAILGDSTALLDRLFAVSSSDFLKCRSDHLTLPGNLCSLLSCSGVSQPWVHI